MKSKRMLIGSWIGIGLLILTMLLQACSPAMERQLQTAVAGPGATVAVSLQTEAVRAGQTAIASGGSLLQTQAAVVQKTAEAGIKTQAVGLQQTAEARMKTEAAKVLTPLSITPTFTPTAIKPQIMDYFALGDSIASGHGLQSIQGLSEDGICKRSPYSYPYRLKATLETQGYIVSMTHLACTGATAGEPTSKEYKNDPLKYRYKWLRNQVIDIQKKIRDDRLTLVTINIGANDIHWADIPVMVWELNQLPGSFTAWTDKLKKTVQDELTDVLTNPNYGLLSRHPNVYVVVNSLYNPLNPDSFIFKLGVSCTIGADLLPDCKLGSQTGGLGLSLCTDFLSTFECKDKADFVITTVNLAIGQVWNNLYKNPAYRNRIWYATVDVAFAGHEAAKGACGASGPSEADSWIQYIGYPQSNEGIPFLYIDKVIPGDCFHPNMEGARQIATSVTKRLKIMGFSVP
jgi:lysophospholipase L1-like esterase